MLNKAVSIRRRFLYLFLGVAALLALAVVGLVFYVGFAIEERLLTGGLGGGNLYYGQRTLEERIAGADVIARVRLLSVSGVAERSAGETGYYAALEHRFNVLEYLKGSGGGELVAVGSYSGREYRTSGGASGLAQDLLNRRDTRWDDREAIVFLRDSHSLMSSIQQADRYWLGSITIDTTHNIEDYSIASRHAKRWLPAASAGGASGAASGSRAPGGSGAKASSAGAQRFLLEAPTSETGARGASGQAATASTITLADMKVKIAAIESEVAAGGGSEAYRDCLASKYEWERKVRYRKEQLGGVYYYIREDEKIASGLPAETLAYTSIVSPYLQREYGETEPSDFGEFVLRGRDEDLFHPRWPGVARTARPLPAGEYKFYFATRGPGHVPCDALPEDELQRIEAFVTVIAPAGAVHEAFFDPADLTPGAGFSTSSGVLEPAGFSIGGTAASITGLKWQSGSVVLTLAPYASLSGHTLDFIALDGSVDPSLPVSSATADSAAGTLTWAVAEQPWRDGDQLMLRIRPAALPAPPAPENLAAAAPARTSVDLSWDAVAGTTKYRVEYRNAASTDWTIDDETVTGTTHTVDGLTCGTAYEFRVSAYGDGTTYAASWGAETPAVPKSTTACNRDPAFDLASYAFSVTEDAATGTAVGTVSATDPDTDDTVSYAITAGNADGAFAIDSSTGAITVAGRLDYETATSHTLTVEADDNAGGTATTTVTISVTDVDEATLSAGVTVTLTPREYEGAFGRPTLGTDITIEWVDPDGCDSQYFVGVYNNEELVRAERPLGLHPAPATTSVTASLGLDWDRVPDYDWWAGVSCTSTSGWTVLAKASIQSGLPMPEVAISDLGATLANGSSDAFTVDASNLDADTSYTIQVTTDDADLGFDSACTDRQEDVTVAASSTSHTASPTLYGCGAPGGTVTATLLSGTTTVHTATQDVTVPNTAATGAPAITGTVQAGETLTADTSGIADEDGLENVSYTYQWLADDADIAGATSSTYELSDDDVGKVIKVMVTFDDDADHEETLTSAATVAVAARSNRQATGAPTITGTVQAGETLTADTSGIADEDGLENVSYTYQWLADDADIAGATSSTYELSDDDVGKVIKVMVTFDDDADHEETLTSAATVAVAARSNRQATGAPTITGTVQAGETLTADTSDIADEDGLDSVSYTYQWLADDADIAGATSSTYELSDDDVGKVVKVTVTFDDDADHEETLTSAATVAVAARSNRQATGVPTITGTVQAGETLTADTSGIADEDGLDSVSYTYQWLADDADIAGATSSTYELSDDDVGKVIKVMVTFDDDADHEETLTSAATVAVAARSNRQATGAPTITGTVQAGETLTADTSDIADEDGLDSVSYTYQWLADDADIDGATSSTYELSDDDVGKLIKITVTFDDDADHEETLTSAATVAVAARPNRAATGAPTISGTAQAGETLTADTSDIADEDGLDSVSYTYQWLADDADIDGATSSTYELSDDDVGKLIKITVTFDDDADHEETLTSAATVAVAARPNRAATGAPTISGTAQAGETLTADTSDIADEDGLDSVSYTYQWLADDADIAGATSSTYELSDDDVGKVIKITVTFDDDADHEETLTSAATEAVAARPSTPGLPTISGTVRVGETLTADTSGIVDEDGLENVSYSYQWLADDAEIEGATAATYTLSDDDMGKVIKVTVTFVDDADHEETRTSEATVAVTSVLTASFENTPAGHDGQNSFTFEVRFSEEVSVGFRRLKDHAFSVTDGATITRARRLERGSSLRWEISVLPGSRDDVTIALPATTDCTTQGAICTTSGKMLSERVELTVRDMGARGAPVISGTVRAGKALTADTSGISDPNGLDNVSYSYQWIADDVDIAEATASTYTLSNAAASKVIKVRVSFDDDADNEETLTSVATVAVVASGPVWTADVSVVDYGPSVGAGSASLFSNEGGSGGLDALWLWYGRTDRQLHLTFTTSVADVDDLILQVGDLSFTFPEGSSGRTFTFSDVDAVDWTDGQTLSASLIWADDVEDES